MKSLKDMILESMEVNEEMLQIGVIDAKGNAATLEDFVKACVDLEKWKDNVGRAYSKYSSYNDLGKALGNLAMDEFCILIGDILKDGYTAEELPAGDAAISTIGVTDGRKLMYKIDIC